MQRLKIPSVVLLLMGLSGRTSSDFLKEFRIIKQIGKHLSRQQAVIRYSDDRQDGNGAMDRGGREGERETPKHQRRGTCTYISIMLPSYHDLHRKTRSRQRSLDQGGQQGRAVGDAVSLQVFESQMLPMPTHCYLFVL